MNRNEFNKSLEDLSRELNTNESLDEDTRSKLLKLKLDIEEMLNDSEQFTAEQRDSLIDNLKESVAQFDGTYPRLAESLHLIIHTLSNMGI